MLAPDENLPTFNQGIKYLSEKLIVTKSSDRSITALLVLEEPGDWVCRPGLAPITTSHFEILPIREGSRLSGVLDLSKSVISNNEGHRFFPFEDHYLLSL